jgi:spermidine dehydrogenase
MPGVSRGRGRDAELPLSFPGGNSAFARFFVKDLIPNSIDGAHSFADILNKSVRFEELDRAGNPIRMRVGATAVRIEHDGPPERARHVWVTYEQGGKAYRVKARGVVMASGGWVNQHIIRDLPEDIVEAYTHFHHSPALIVNVALTNWRFMYKLGITAAEWYSGFGWSANLRQPMIVGDYKPPLDPDKPTVLTFYTGIATPGLPVYEQGVQGRWKLFSTTFAEYERQIREQMVRQFGSAGFDPERDIAGIILNRWGHARLVQQPGYYHGRDGRPSPREVVQRGFGRIVVGHSELNGHQSWSGGVAQGYRAAEQILDSSGY